MKEFKWTYIGEHELTNEEWDIVHDKIGEILDENVGEEWGMFGTSDMSTSRAEQDTITVIRCADCPHSMSFTEQAKKWMRICTHFNMSVPNDWFCAIPVREREGAEHETD